MKTNAELLKKVILQKDNIMNKISKEEFKTLLCYTQKYRFWYKNKFGRYPQFLSTNIINNGR